MRIKEAIAMHHGKALLSAVCWTLLLSCARADDWPQWQGLNRDNISKESGSA